MSGGAAILESSPRRDAGGAGQGRITTVVHRLRAGDAVVHVVTVMRIDDPAKRKAITDFLDCMLSDGPPKAMVSKT